MFTPGDEGFLRGAVAGLCGRLQTALGSAAEIADLHFAEFDGFQAGEVEPVRNHLARLHAVRLLRTERLGDWVVGRARPNARIVLRNELLTMRILRAAPAPQVPPPGGNLARREYYSNQQLDAFGVYSSRLLGLWNDDPDTAEVSVRVVRPVGIWKYGHRARVDIDSTLPMANGDLEDLQFWPDDADVEVELPFEDDLPDVEDEGDES